MILRKDKRKKYCQCSKHKIEITVHLTKHKVSKEKKEFGLDMSIIIHLQSILIHFLKMPII